MSKRFKFLPLGLFFLFLVGLGYLFWKQGEDTIDPTPTALIKISPTAPPTRVESVRLTPTPTASPPDGPIQPTKTLTSETFSVLTATPVPPTPPPPTTTPTPALITGTITINGALNVRRGPGEAYGFVGAVYGNDEVFVLGREESGSWLQIVTPNQKTGWAVARYISTTTNVLSLSVLPTPPPPSEAVASAFAPRPLDFNRQIDIEGRSIADELGPYEEHWYTFYEEDPQTVVVFMFKPNINFYGENFVGYNVEFFLYDQNLIPAWPPGDADSVRHIGSGQADPAPQRDRDGDLKSGELVWRGGPLVPGVPYYLRFVNRSSQSLGYCLAPGDVYEWTCPEN